MKLYNTLTRQSSDFVPLNGTNVRMYSCGPTIYDHIHIGNLSSFIFADSLRRTLQLDGNAVKHIMNFTDIDDKTIAASRRQYPDLQPQEALLRLTSYYADIFLKDMDLVGNDISSLSFVKATDAIANIQALIIDLHKQGFAYVADDGIYFSIAAYRKSGKVYGQLTEITTDSTGEARIQNDEYDKASPHDFALWKRHKSGEPAWDFKLDGADMKGRPGWHIECSAMSTAELGQPFDIHTGGVDLIFPHHENEIAQSTAGKNLTAYAKVFAHNEHLLVDSQKMSKSLNNFYTLQDIIAKGFDPLAFRLLVLQAHYRSQAHFSWENLEAAQNRLNNLQAFADLKWQVQMSSSSNPATTNAESIKAAMFDDLNTPIALAFLNGYAAVITERLVTNLNAEEHSTMLQLADALFGLRLNTRPDVTEEQKQLIAQREAARQAQDWAKSDEIRDQLQQQGIGLRDTPHGAIWFRLSPL